MNGHLVEAITITIFSSLFLLGMFILASRKSVPFRFSKYWIVGWSFNTLRYAFELVCFLFPDMRLFSDLALAMTGISATFLLAAAISLERPVGFGYASMAASGMIAAGVAIASLLKVPQYPVTVVFLILFGVIQGYTGLRFAVLGRKNRSKGIVISGIAQMLWGIHKCSYPFLRESILMNVHFQVASLLALLTGSGIIIFLYEMAKKEATDTAERYKALFDNISEAVLIADIQDGQVGRICEANKATTRILGYTHAELLGMTPDDLDFPGDPANVDHHDKPIIHWGGALFTRMQRTKEGKPLHVEINARRFFIGDHPYVLGIERDLSDRDEEARIVAASTAKIATALKEKEVLLREIHHRVKNNLQVISSLLSLQGEASGDPRLERSFEESKARINSIALVHDKLYRSTNLAEIDMGDYLRQLAIELQAAVSAKAAVQIHVDAESIPLGIDTAVPVGLIVAELMTNALKHAFTDRAEGSVRVGLVRRGPNLHLEVSDDGIGLPPEPKKLPGLGRTLIQALTTQIDGRLEYDGTKGFTCSIDFPFPS